MLTFELIVIASFVVSVPFGKFSNGYYQVKGKISQQILHKYIVKP
jgi:hypothetical protein